jgi:hypothetical protein
MVMLNLTVSVEVSEPVYPPPKDVEASGARSCGATEPSLHAANNAVAANSRVMLAFFIKASIGSEWGVHWSSSGIDDAYTLHLELSAGAGDD